MKPTFSLLLVISLIQSLLIGNLVNFELYNAEKGQWQETYVQKQELLDIFVVPPRGNIIQSVQNRNYCIPFQYSTIFAGRIEIPLAWVAGIPSGPVKAINYNPAPLFILNGAIRI